MKVIQNLSKGVKTVFSVVSDDISYLFFHYKNSSKKFLINFFLTLIFFFLAIAILGIKIFYPYHLLISFLLFLSSIIFSYVCLFTFRKKIKDFKTYNIASKKKRFIIFSIIILFCLIAINTVAPFTRNQFLLMSKNEIKTIVDRDKMLALFTIDRLENAGANLLQNESLLKNNLSLEEREELIRNWEEYLKALVEAENLIDRHKYFYQISLFKYPSYNHFSFLIAYSLYAQKHEYAHLLINKINDNNYIKKVLNEKSEIVGVNNVYQAMAKKYYNPENILKLNLGKIYLKLIGNQGGIKEDEVYSVLFYKATESYDYLFNSLELTIKQIPQVSADFFEKNMFDTWFPIQKGIANAMGNTYLSRREEKLITEEQVKEMKKYLLPGDIMTERRNWYASNIGIPGFWPHSALYVGDLDKANSYFQDIFPFEGYNDFVSYIKNINPEVYNILLTKDSSNNPLSVIEGKAEGIILQSLEESADADYVAVMRPNLSKRDKLQAIIRAFGNYGKPYDYNFDFETRDELVCSELIYDAYLQANNKKGLNFKLSEVTGRKIFSPNDIVKYFSEEYNNPNRELDFVYFIDGNENLGEANSKGVEEFLDTWTRPKYDIIQE